ncbi:protein kinase [Sorangium cellulosum]|uniref:Protein kinase n=1 Tax=Sorangium cellulosum TaxID=56 RepID=A0A2L0EVW1_SORCE|nr:serine/threonine-protein kinase [Sorangium cellulosum]AUX43434.1 protein kinase [Sorangium cellulosum]
MRPGEVINGRFELERVAASGGMGTVYRALDRTTGTPVALKLIGQPDRSAVHRFEHEARILADLDHPRIVRHVAHGITPDGAPFLAMEWLDGESLAQRLARQRLDLDECLALLRAAAEALAAAHARGVVHRDVKPGNLLLVGGEVSGLKVLDFGIALMKRTIGPLTRTGSVMGTPGYMAPEQATGERDRLDARADIFSLGAVLFECLTGRPAFQGQHVMALLAKLLMEDPPRVRHLRPELPQELDDFVARMLAKDPERRPRDGSAVLEALDALARDPSSGLSAAPVLYEAITTGELRLLSMVAAKDMRHGPAEGSASTLVAAQPPELSTRLHTSAQPFRARVDTLADGTLLLSVAGEGDAIEQAARAARCALKLGELLPGASVVLATGRAEQTGSLPVGPVMDRAAALLALAEHEACAERAPAPVRIDDVTRALLDARFEIEAARSGTFLLLQEREVGRTARTLLGKPSPYVGRDRELRNLRELLEDSFGGPEPRAILITGPPGIGKSRLRYELVEVLRERHPELTLAVGRGDSLSAGSPFSLLGSALRSAAGITGGEPAAAQRERLLSLVARAPALAPGDRTRIAAFLGEIVGTPFPSEADERFHEARQRPALMADQIPLAYLAFMEAACAAGPYLLVLEDIQWGDAASLKLISRALRELRDRPFAVLYLARVEVRKAFPILWEGSEIHEITLGALPRRAAEELVRQMLGDGLPPSEVARLVERASGNAFYLEELIRAVAEGRADRLPETILGMVEARLDAIPAEARRLLRAASVFGETFWKRGALALLGDAEGSTLAVDWLPWMLQRELLERREQSRFSDQEEYAFRHALIRDGCYAMLPEHDRALGHRLAAEWLLQAGEHDSKVLAEHFERGGEPRLAVELYLHAAEQALAGSDPAAAIALAERGLALGAERDVDAALRGIHAQASGTLGAEGVALASSA